jgi:putative flippase GtrA
MLESKLEEVSVVSDMPVVSDMLHVQSASSLPSYHPYPWTFANSLLDIVDTVTQGRAGVVQRFCTYIVIGGFAVLVNLAVFSLVLRLSLPINGYLLNIIASVLAAEISILANFIPNDYFTFRHLPGHARSWSARCSRFHITSIGGSVLTFLLQFGFHYVGHVLAFLAQAIALLLALLYNFTFHHIFTYRRVEHA